MESMIIISFSKIHYKFLHIIKARYPN